MYKCLSNLGTTCIAIVFLLTVTPLHAQTATSSSNADSVETYTVTSVPAENGTYSIHPKIPADGRVPAGTVLKVKAKPAPGYSLDAVLHCKGRNVGNHQL